MKVRLEAFILSPPHFHFFLAQNNSGVCSPFCLFAFSLHTSTEFSFLPKLTDLPLSGKPLFINSAIYLWTLGLLLIFCIYKIV